MVGIRDFAGVKQDDEISFRKGDYVKVISKDQPDWWTGEINGMVGTFPSHCVEYPSEMPKPSYQLAEAVRDFEALSKKELELRKGDIITLTDTSHGTWWKGESGGRKGMFPSTHVKMMAVPPVSPIGQNNLTPSAPRSERPTDSGDRQRKHRKQKRKKKKKHRHQERHQSDDFPIDDDFADDELEKNNEENAQQWFKSDDLQGGGEGKTGAVQLPSIGGAIAQPPEEMQRKGHDFLDRPDKKHKRKKQPEGVRELGAVQLGGGAGILGIPNAMHPGSGIPISNFSSEVPAGLPLGEVSSLEPAKKQLPKMGDLNLGAPGGPIISKEEEKRKRKEEKAKRKALKRSMKAAIRMQKIFRNYKGKKQFQMVRIQRSIASGVIPALPGTTQGRTGWYQNPKTNTVYFYEVNAAGQWTQRLQKPCSHIILTTNDARKIVVGPLCDIDAKAMQFARRPMLAVNGTVQGKPGFYENIDGTVAEFKYDKTSEQWHKK